MKGNRRQRDYVKTHRGLKDEDLQRIAESRKVFGKLPVLRRDGHDWLAAVDSAVLTGVSRRKLHTQNESLGAKQFQVHAGPWRGMAWHYRKDKLIEHYPGILPDNGNSEAMTEILTHAKAIRKTSDTTLDTVILTDTKVSRIVTSGGHKVKIKGKLPEGRPPKPQASVDEDAKTYRDWKNSGMKQAEFDRERNWDSGTTAAAAKKHLLDSKRGRASSTQN